MNARQTTAKHAQTLTNLLSRMQTAAAALPDQDEIHWGHAGQTRAALEHTISAAFALGVINADEARELGFPC
jgi:hypothetical protein